MVDKTKGLRYSSSGKHSLIGYLRGFPAPSGTHGRLCHEIVHNASMLELTMWTLVRPRSTTTYDIPLFSVQ